MWQFCDLCKVFVYKLGRTCPCCMSFALWQNSVPKPEVQQQLNAIWKSLDYDALPRLLPHCESHTCQTPMIVLGDPVIPQVYLERYPEGATHV
jgi:hypothetical protein